MRLLVFGGSGRLGRALAELAETRGDELTSLRRKDADLADGAAVRQAVAAAKPDVVVNAAAYNTVDAAESEPGAAYAVNAQGPANIATACAEVGARFVHVSTDYVFDGEKGAPYVEDDAPNPVSVYGLSKLSGEALAEWKGGGGVLVCRTAVLYGPHPHGPENKVDNFLERIIDAARKDPPPALKGVSDLTISPTYTPDLAAMILGLVAQGASGVFHTTGGGACNRHELMVELLRLIGSDLEVEPVSQESFGAAAKRPRFSALDSRRASELSGVPLRDWREGLERYLGARGLR